MGSQRRSGSEVAAGFEIETVGAHELAFLLVEPCPAIWAGAFDLFNLRAVTCAGRHAACRLVVPCRNTPQDGLKSWRRQPDGASAPIRSTQAAKTERSIPSD